ncbi:unnamed protein product, partial [Rotaria sordida]
MIDPKNNFR